MTCFGDMLGDELTKEIQAVLPECLTPVSDNADAQAQHLQHSAHSSGNVQQLLEKLVDGDSGVRWEATKALGQLATKDDALVVSGLLGRIADPSRLVRNDAVEALVQVSVRGNSAVVASLLELLSHETWYVREAAARTLGRATTKGDVRATKGLVRVLKDQRDEVVQSSLGSLGMIARRGDPKVVDALLEQLGSGGSWVTKSATASALAQVAEFGEERVVSALLEKLNEPHEEVRRAAMAALPHLADASDRHLIDLLIDTLACTSSIPDARAAAASLLGKVVGDAHGPGRGISTIVVSALLMHARNAAENWLVRRACIDALTQIVPKGQVDIVHGLLPLVHDQDTGVRQAAIEAFTLLAPRGHEDIVCALLPILDGSGGSDDERLPFMRKAAVEALGAVAEVGDARVVQVVLKTLNDPSDGVREAAGEALKRVSEAGDDAVLEALLSELMQDEG